MCGIRKVDGYLWRPHLLLLAICIATAAALPLWAQDAGGSFSIAPPPAWVAEADLPASEAPAVAQTEAEACLLLDYQTNVATGEQYTRVVKELRTAGGVATGSTVTAWFDPAYQHLVLHHLRVIRDGTASSRLSRPAVHLLRRELSLEAQVLDGTLTARVVIEDVRPGDRIDAAFTVRGRNPALSERYVDSFTCGWPLPVARERVRILCPAGRSLQFRLHGAQREPSRRSLSGLEEYVWEFANTPAISAEDLTPSWHVTQPWLQVSEFRDWSEVSLWAAALYPPSRLPAELEGLAAGWRSEATSMQRALAALDWVQQNIRYVGVESGIGSLVPSPPAVVCERRFGDCKDQSYLLCALLRRLGVEADPVLVNTWARQLVAEMLPSPFAFNHVITRIRSDGRTYFVDPSNSFQRGPIAHRFMPDYGRGLAATGEKGSLWAFGSHQGLAPEIEVLTTFQATQWDQSASLEVQSVRKGGAADQMRQVTATTRLEELSRGYLNYYAARYPGLQPAGDLLLEDDPELNVLRLVERYSLPEFWLAREDPRGYHTEVFADAISDAIPVPQTKVRSTPLAVGHPLRVYQRIRIELPEPSTAKSRKAQYSNAAFDLAVSHVHDGRTVTLSYDFQTHAAAVPAKEALKYQRSLLEIDPELWYELWTEDTVPANPNAVKPLPLGVAIAALAALVAGAILAYRRVARPAALPPQPEYTPGLLQALPIGLGGWLILVVIGLVVRPLIGIGSLRQLAPMLTVGSWNAFASPGSPQYHPLWATLMLFELVANSGLVVANILLLVFFFQRRRVFPQSFIYLLIAHALTALADFVLGRAVFGSEATGSSPPQVFGMAVTGGLWIAYMLRSTRVKLTFTR